MVCALVSRAPGARQLWYSTFRLLLSFSRPAQKPTTRPKTDHLPRNRPLAQYAVIEGQHSLFIVLQSYMLAIFHKCPQGKGAAKTRKGLVPGEIWCQSVCPFLPQTSIPTNSSPNLDLTKFHFRFQTRATCCFNLSYE
jgi:hypothetical protein